MKCLLSFVVLAFLFAPTTSFADPSIDYIRVECNKELDYLLIHKIRLDISVSETLSKKTKANLYKKYNLIDSSNLISYNEAENIQTAKTSKTSCKLKDGKYDVTLEDYIMNSNPNGMCGGWSSTFVSVKKDDKTIIDSVPFDESCNSEKSMSQIVITPAQKYVTISALGEEKTIFDDQLPVKSEQIFSAP